MARRRYLSTDVSKDKVVNRLAMEADDFAALLYTWMIPHAGDDATVEGDPEELLMVAMPGRRDKQPEDIANALTAMDDRGIIEWDRDAGVVRFPKERWRRLRGRPTLSQPRIEWLKTRNQARPRILERDGYGCVRCDSTDRLEIDHILPLARGGGNEDDNLQTLCRPCNRRKWAFLPDEEARH